MINDFLVRANREKNELKIVLDGYFMKSELDLAFQLARQESRKLMPGFDVFVNIRNLNIPNKELLLDFERFERILKIMGGGSLKIVGLENTLSGFMYRNVGLYPYENAWFL